MSLGAFIVMAAIGVTLAFGFFHYTGGARQTETRDPSEALMEFARAYPAEAIRSITMTSDGQACFLRLADGKTGFLQSMGRHFVARLMLPGAVMVEALSQRPGLRIEFQDSTISGGDYIFNSTEEAAEVSLWLCGSFALANPDADGPEEEQNS